MSRPRVKSCVFAREITREIVSNKKKEKKKIGIGTRLISKSKGAKEKKKAMLSRSSLWKEALDIRIKNPYECEQFHRYTWTYKWCLIYVITYVRPVYVLTYIMPRSFLDTSQDRVRRRTRDRLFLTSGSLGSCLRRAHAAKDKAVSTTSKYLRRRSFKYKR